MITDNQVYTFVKNKVVAKYSGAFVTGSRIYTTEQWPTVSIVCIDSTPISETIDFSESNRRSTFDVNVYSNNSLTEAKKIATVVRNAFKECGYRCKVFEPLDNALDPNIKRYVGRFSRAIGDGDTLNNQ
jgi:hypothetical protein